MESGGIEDARVNPVDSGFAITYSAYHGRVPNQVRVALATTGDFAQITRHGPMLEQNMRNVVAFPERIDGRWVGLFRPNDSAAMRIGGGYTQIRIGYADDLRSGPWTIHDEPIMCTGAGPGAFSDKIGPGAPPVRTRHGGLNLFHGVRTTMDGNPYVLGVALHDADDPRKVQMSSIPVLLPSRADCRWPRTTTSTSRTSCSRVNMLPAWRRQHVNLPRRQRHGDEPRLLARGRPGRAVPEVRAGPAHRRASLRPLGRSDPAMRAPQHSVDLSWHVAGSSWLTTPGVPRRPTVCHDVQQYR